MTLSQKRHVYLYILLLFALGFWVYGGLYHAFYQQDEWAVLGYELTRNVWGYLQKFSLIKALSGFDRILAVPLNYLFFRTSPFVVWPIVTFTILIHSVNSTLVAFFTYKITKERVAAGIAGLFFLLAFSGSQAITWFAANTTTLPCAFFVLLALIFYYQYIVDKKPKNIILAYLWAFIGYLFKESALFLTICFPALYILLENKKSWKKGIQTHWAIICYGIFLVVARLFELFSHKDSIGVAVSRSSVPVVKIVIHALLYPLVSLSQLYIHPQLLYALSDIVMQAEYGFIVASTVAAPIIQTLMSDFLSLFFSFCLLLFIVVLAVYHKKLRQSFCISLAVVLTSFLPYIILDRGSAYLDSRYAYIGLIGAGMILGIIGAWCWKILMNSRVLVWKTLAVCFLVAGFLYLGWQTVLVRRDIYRLVVLSQERMHILFQVKALHPSLGAEPIVYVSGNEDFYVQGLKVPFQQGFGYTLMVWYSRPQWTPVGLLGENFLWGIKEQGYKEDNGIGFGYFWDKETLLQEIKLKKLSVEQVVGLYYDSSTKRVYDVTGDIRTYLRAHL